LKAPSSTFAGQRLVLASASPRRLQLLGQIGFVPNAVVDPGIDETILPGEPPREVVLRLARLKAGSVATRYPGDIVLAADTVVARGRRVLPKPETEAAARRCLKLLSGVGHRVYGGLVVIAPHGREVSRTVVTRVTFKRLSHEELDLYLTSGEWQDKAGGYAIQGRAAAFVRKISGSYSNVVGLALYETASILHGIGLAHDDAR